MADGKHRHKPGEIDWGAIRLEYIKGGTSLRGLAKKHGVSLSCISAKCKAENWVGQKSDFGARAVQKAQIKLENHTANKLASLMRSSDLLSQRIEEVLGDPDQFEARVVDARGISDMAKALRLLNQTIRDLYDLPSGQEQLAREIAKEKLELERKKASAESNSGIQIELDGSLGEWAK